jgi:rubrerythrin
MEKKMNLNEYNLEDLFLSAIKSEVESNKLYSNIAKKIKNGLLQDKLEFLAKEEEKHKKFIEVEYLNHFPDKKIILPNKTPVPLPEIIIDDENIPLSKILMSAMQAEKAAQDFYKAFADRFEEGTKINHTLKYFSDMELGHYKLLEIEKESMERFEEADVYWPMMHIGP